MIPADANMTVVEEFDYLCRLCAAKTGILMGLPIFEAGEQMRNIAKKIAACLPVQVNKQILFLFLIQNSCFELTFYESIVLKK